METTITITSKGQATLPVALRRLLGVDKSGGVLKARFDAQKKEIIISKPPTIDEISERVSKYVKPGAKPVVDVDAWYQENRELEI